MIADEEQAVDDDIGSNEFLQEIDGSGQDTEFTRLTEMVRKHYLNYLEKQLHENLLNSNYINKKNKDDNNETYKKFIKKTAELLEGNAVKACMIAKFYQRAMVKIIAIVRRRTAEKRILTHLEKAIQTTGDCKPLFFSKETQTEGILQKEILNSNLPFANTETLTVSPIDCKEDNKNIISLDEKIEMFKKHLKKDKFGSTARKDRYNNKDKKFRRHKKRNDEFQSSSAHCRQSEQCHPRYKQEAVISPTTSIVNVPTSSISPVIESSLVERSEANIERDDNSNDSVALELARLFSEEKTELDEIFGIDPNDEPDDPQICRILKEIEESKVTDVDVSESTSAQSKSNNPQPRPYTEPQKVSEQFVSIDLSKSIWPCELFMHKRKLSESLARLIEEDLRWHDIMKWKFCELFGEDSDDEFATCSPSIELNEVLIGSCIRRISPWVVHYLMKPMRDGLIGNRFLFKKLAKNLSRSIIMENQYPDEAIIQEYVENFFCLHQAVLSIEDLNEYIPSLAPSC